MAQSGSNDAQVPRHEEGPKRGPRARARFWLCFILTLAVPAALAQAEGARAWGWSVHRAVASNALDLLPGGVRDALSSYRGMIVEWSVMPDVLKSSDWYEQYRHWYHVDVPHDEQQYWDGVLPWAVENYFVEMVRALRGDNLAGAAQLAGRLSHYIADASMPLHATKYYDGMHSPFERAADEHLGELHISLPGYSPRALENVFEATMELLRRSYGYSQEVRSELYRVSTWTPRLEEITEEQLRAAVALTADVWYTAYLEATSPERMAAPLPLSPDEGAVLREPPVLRWAPAGDAGAAISYEILLDEDPGFPSPRTFDAGSETELPLPQLEDGEYYWRVLARASDGRENLSEVRRFLVDTTPPAAPTLLLPANGSRLSGALTFEWSSVEDLTGVTYELLLDEDPGFESPRLRVGGLLEGSYELGEALEEGTWYWRVLAVDGAGNESWSETFHFTIGGAKGKPSFGWAAFTIAAIAGALAMLLLLAAARRPTRGAKRGIRRSTREFESFLLHM